MTRQIRRVAIVVLLAFLTLLSSVFYWQVLAANRLTNDPRNTRTLIKEYSIERGQIVAGKTVLARSVPTNDPLKFLRQYPKGPDFAFVTGFYSLVYGRSGIEQSGNDYLIGQGPEQFASNLVDLLTARSRPGGTLLLTLDPATQAAANAGLGARRGAVVALDPSTGAVLALTSFPRYNPNQLSSHDPAKIQKARTALLAAPGNSLFDRALQGTYPPGSTFKVITAAAALSDLHMTPDSPQQNARVYDVPQTSRDIANFGGESCLGGKNPITLAEAFEVSCNTVFARLGNQLGAARLVTQAEQFGLNAPDPITDLSALKSSIPNDLDVPSTAQSAIGQRDVQVTPLQMAEVAAAVANDGVRMKPYVVGRVLAPDGSTVKNVQPRQVRHAVPSDVAAALKSMMAAVVERGTGTAAQIPGIQVFGKTGTAQHAAGQPPHAWFIGFASSGGRQIAVAVVVENGGNVGSEATGGKVAAPIAREVMRTYLQGGSP